MNKYNWSQDWFTSSIPVFEMILKELKGKPNLNYLEIGSFEGRSMVWMFENILTDETSRATCIDDFSGVNKYNEGKILKEGLKDRFLANLSPFKGKFRLIEGDSKKILRKKFEDETFDIIYVDGGHEAHETLLDGIYSVPLLKVGGYILFDDYSWNLNNLPDHKTPKIAIDAFISCLKGRFRVVTITWKTVILQKLI